MQERGAAFGPAARHVPQDDARGNEMTGLDYNTLAEVYPGQRRGRRPSLGYRRFDTAAAALQYLLEDLPAGELATVTMEVDEVRYGPNEIRKLYYADEYPLARTEPPNPSKSDGQ